MDHRYSVAINVWHKYLLASVRRYLKSKQGQLRAAIVAQLVKSVCLKPRGAQFESLHRRVFSINKRETWNKRGRFWPILNDENNNASDDDDVEIHRMFKINVQTGFIWNYIDDQCDQMTILLFKIWSFSTMTVSLLSQTLAKVGSKLCQILN